MENHRIVELENNLAVLEQRIIKLEKKFDTRKQTDYTIKLEAAKADFLERLPELDTTPFTDTEMVFYISYLLSKTQYRERLTSWAEIGKRVKKIKQVIKFFAGQDTEDVGVMKARVYFDYIVSILDEVLFDPNSNVFYVITSDWSLNKYGNNIGELYKINQFQDTPAKV